jgi:hypothetical protein
VRGPLGLGAVLLLVGLSCIDENPAGPAAKPGYFETAPGTRWTYEYVIDDSARYWMNVLRDEPTVVAGDTVWALDFYADGQLTTTQYLTAEGNRVYMAGERTVTWEDTLVEVYAPPLLLSPSDTGPAQTWSSVASVTSYKITSAGDTLVSEGYLTWTGRVLGEEQIRVPAFGAPVNTLWIEYYGEADPWAPPEAHSYFWLAEGVGPVRTIDLTFGGRTENNLSEFERGK